MRSIKKRIFSVLLFCTLILCLCIVSTLTAAVADVYGDYEYTISNGAVTITKYIGGGSAVEIPSKLDGYPVREIGRYAFRQLTNNTEIYSNLENINVLQKFTTPSDSVTSIFIPASVKKIDASSIVLWTLESITVDKANKYYASVNGILFSKDMKTLYLYPANHPDTSFVVPSSVTTLSASFRNCEKLESVILPENLTSIPKSLFNGCQSLKQVLIPESVTYIGPSAFGACMSLASIRIPDGVTAIYSLTFAACPDLSSIYIPALYSRQCY